MIFWVGSILLLFSKCKSSSILDIVKKRYIAESDSSFKTSCDDSLYFGKQKQYVSVLKYYCDPRLRGISGYLLGDKYGNEFQFDYYGYLRSYEFITDGSHYSYGVFYNKDSSRHIEIGTPLLDYINMADENEDKNVRKCSFLFSSFPRATMKISYSLDGKTFREIEHNNFFLMPYVYDVVLKLPLNVKTVYFKMEATDIIKDLYGLENSKTFFGSSTLK